MNIITRTYQELAGGGVNKLFETYINSSFAVDYPATSTISTKEPDQEKEQEQPDQGCTGTVTNIRLSLNQGHCHPADIDKIYYNVSDQSARWSAVKVTTVVIFKDGYKSVVSETFLLSDKANIKIDRSTKYAIELTPDCKERGLLYALLKATLGSVDTLNTTEKTKEIKGNGYIRKFHKIIDEKSKTNFVRGHD